MLSKITKMYDCGAINFASGPSLGICQILNFENLNVNLVGQWLIDPDRFCPFLSVQGDTAH